MDSDTFYQMKTFRPVYVREFKCDGKACDSRCCRDWKVTVDEDTRQKYLNLPDDERENFFRHVTNENSIRPTNSGACPFLNDELLCNLQLKRGEEFLPAVCQSFPRVTYKLDDETFLQAMTLTCPVAAIEILLRDEPITFETVDGVNARLVFDFTKKLSRPVKEFLFVQHKAIEILQRRDLSINRRLKRLCRIFGEKSVPVHFDSESNAAALAEIFGETYDAGLTVDKKTRLIESYLVARKNVLTQMYENFSTVAENWLVNEFVMRLYPCAFVGDDSFNCRVFVTSFRLAEFAAVLTALARGRLTVEILLEMLCALDDKLAHSTGGMEAIKAFAALHESEVFAALMLDD